MLQDFISPVIDS